MGAKVNRPLGLDLETVLERRPNKEGLFDNIEDCGPSHLGPLTNTHTCDVLNKCLEMGRPTMGVLTISASNSARLHRC